MKERKECVFLVNTLDSGGIENYLLRFLNYYDGKIIPTVICKGNAFGDLENEYRKISDIQLVRMKVGYVDFQAYRNLYKFFKQKKYDAVVDFTGNFAAFPLSMAKYAGTKNRIVFYRGATNHFKENFLKNTYNDFLNLMIRNTATGILSNSKAALRFFFNKQNDPRFEVIYNGIDAEKFLNSQKTLREELSIPDNGFVIAHVGRFTEAKNHKTIIEVAVQLCKLNKDVYFILCGRDVDVSLKGRVEKEQLSDRIKLLGYRKDVISILNSSDAFYFPSLTEGQPNALLEALIAGLPFVASNIDPIKETIPEEFHDYLIEPMDILGAINRLQQIFENEETRKSLDLSLWAKENYEPGHLFNKFYIKL
ncbi:putative glycosyltransferase EpsF [compost metagenome]